jgi:hypothetical protein
MKWCLPGPLDAGDNKQSNKGRSERETLLLIASVGCAGAVPVEPCNPG